MNLIDYHKVIGLLNIYDEELCENLMRLILNKSYNFTNQLLYTFMVNLFQLGVVSKNYQDQILEFLTNYLKDDNLPKRLLFYITLNLILIDLPTSHLLISQYASSLITDKMDDISFYKENYHYAKLIQEFLNLYLPEKEGVINFLKNLLEESKNEISDHITFENSFYEKFLNYVKKF